VHYKKVTNSILVKELDKQYLIYSDKFGEIYIKKLNQVKEPPIILYGHSDPIHFMRISPFNNVIISADTFGKIKICEFPNIFNFLSVLFYENEDIKYVDFFSSKELMVLNSEHWLHFWSTEDFQIKYKFQLETVLETVLANDISIDIVNIKAIIPFKEKFIYIETNDSYYILEKEEHNLTTRKKVSKQDTDGKSFFISEENKIISSDGEKVTVIDI
jgi:hypothetical protein